MRRLISLFLICLVSVSLFVGCGNDSSNVTNISILNSKPEMEEALNDLIEEFTKQNNDINIKVVKYSQSGVYKDKLDSMQSIDNAPTMALIDPSNINLYADRCLNLSEENWVSNIVGGVDEIAKNKDGQVVAFPFATEGIGLIYNKKVLSEAGVDVNSINTISSLEESFKKIEASGKKGIVVTNEEWSLGDHFSATFYEVDRKKFNKSAIEYLNSISNEDLRSNATLNGLLDTFDLMKKYNIYAENPLAPSYDKCAEIFGKGEVVFWYMGNWASQSILNNSLGNNEFGFIPVPISNNANDYGNNEIVLGVTKYIVIDSENSSEEQKEAAKRFLDFIVYSDDGEKFLVEDAGVIPAFDNIEVTSNDPLIKDIINYRDQNKTMNLMNSYLPSDYSSNIGSAFKKYLNNEMSREELISTIQTYWS